MIHPYYPIFVVIMSYFYEFITEHSGIVGPVKLIPMLGEMHFLVSFIGNIGVLMVNTSQEYILSAALGMFPRCLLARSFHRVL